MTERLTTEAFVSKIENSAAWNCTSRTPQNEPILTVFNRHREPTKYFGPALESFSEDTLNDFWQEINRAAIKNGRNEILGEDNP